MRRFSFVLLLLILLTPWLWATDTQTPLPVRPAQSGAIIDSNNSTTVTLSGNGVYNGTATDITNYTQVCSFVYSDKSSAANGLAFKFSTDNLTWGYSETLTITGGSGEFYCMPAHAKYFKLSYTNGSSNQGTFLLQTFLRVIPVSATTMAVDLSLTDDTEGFVTKSLLSGKSSAGGGAYVDVKVNPSGTLEVHTSQLPDPLAITDATSNPTVTQIQDFLMGWNGATWDRLQVDGSKQLKTIDGNSSSINSYLSTLAGTVSSGKVTVTGTITTTPPSNASTNIAQINAHTTLEAGQNGALAIGGNQATNNNISGNTYPVLIGGSDYGGTPKIQNLKVDSSGNASVINTAPTGGGSFSFASSNSDQTLTSHTCLTVTLLNPSSNTHTIFLNIGAAATTSTFPLAPGASYSFATSSTGNVHIIASAGTDSVVVIYQSQ